MRYNPFNPQQPADPVYFVGRTEEISKFTEFLSQTIYGSPMNMTISGNRGIGKTSILLKFERIAKDEKCLTLRLSNYEGNIQNIPDLVDHIIINLKREILVEHPIGTLGEWARTIRPVLTYKDLSLTLEKEKDILVEKIFHDQLQNIWNDVKKDHPAIVILIDEAEALERIVGSLAFLREVFQRISRTSKYMVVLSGKLNFKERMAESFSPLNRFFPTTELLPLKDEEVREYVKRKLDSVNVEISEEVIDKIRITSECHPYVVVAMCHMLFKFLGENMDMMIDKELFDKTLPRIKEQLAQDFFISLYHPLTPKAKEVIVKIASKLNKLKFSFSEAVSLSGLKRNVVAPYIQELVRKGCLNKPKRGEYEIFHSLFLEFLKEQRKQGHIVE